MTAILTMNDVGSVVLPQPMRDQLHLKPGSRLKADVVDNRIMMEIENPAFAIAQAEAVQTANAEAHAAWLKRLAAHRETTRGPQQGVPLQTLMDEIRGI